MEAITKATGGTNVYTISSETNISPPFVYHANSPIGIIDILGGGGPIGKGEQEGEHQHVKKTMMSVGGPVPQLAQVLSETGLVSENSSSLQT
jgi:hypothetical protein